MCVEKWINQTLITGLVVKFRSLFKEVLPQTVLWFYGLVRFNKLYLFSISLCVCMCVCVCVCVCLCVCVCVCVCVCDERNNRFIDVGKIDYMYMY